MTRFLAPITALCLTVGVAEARAERIVVHHYHSSSGFAEWLIWGPSISPLFVLTGNDRGLDANGLVRMGTLAGLPVQLELALGSSPRPDEPADIQLGLRVLAFSVSEEGLRRGGLPGHNLGGLGGFTPWGFYAGAVYEWLVIEEIGLVAEFQWRFDTGQPAYPSLHVGAKFQFPTLGRL